MALRIGLTGGIGSGKTIVARVFEALGIPVYYADQAAKRLMNESELLRSKIAQHFGENAYTDKGLNRPYIASVVFNNKEKLNLLNAIVHPVTIADSQAWFQAQATPYAVKEAALIFESASNTLLNFVIGVYTPPPLRVQRVATRDLVSTEDVYRRMENQMPDEEKMKLCDFVIVNDEHQLVVPQVLMIHERLVGSGNGQWAKGNRQTDES